MQEAFEYDIFVSFSSQDIEWVKTIHEKLIENGLSAFFSHHTLKVKSGN